MKSATSDEFAKFEPSIATSRRGFVRAAAGLAACLAGGGLAQAWTGAGAALAEDDAAGAEEAGTDGDPATDARTGSGAADGGPNTADALRADGGQERELMGSPDPCDVRVGLVMGPPSMGLNQFMVDARGGLTGNRFSFEVCGIDYAAVAARFNQGDFDIVTLPSNIGAVLYNNPDINLEPLCISITNLGILYVLTTDPSLTQITDLVGRTVYVFGEGGTPEYTIDRTLAGWGIDGQVDVVFKSTPFEILNLLQEQPNTVAILPQPFVEVARLLVPGLIVPIDMTQMWFDMPDNDGSQPVMATTLVDKAFLEAHEQAVIEYLRRAKASAQFTNENVEIAASRQEELDTFLSNNVAASAIPHCNIVCITGQEMRVTLEGFLQAICDRDPEAVGGAMPGDDFYYMPPLGAFEE